MKSSPWRDGKGDMVREFVDAFRAEGLQVGLYLSPWDRHEKCYGDSPRYNDFYCAQLTELLTQYGELHEVWFDGACAEGPNGRKQVYDWRRIFSLVKQLQPNAVTFGDGGTDVRWVGNERGIAGETCWATINSTRLKFPGDSGICEANDAKARADIVRSLNEGDAPVAGEPRLWRPAECDVSIRPGWFYHAEEDAKVRSVENLVDLYFRSVGRNGLLLLNVPPMPDGRFNEADISALRGFRSELDRIFVRDLAHGASVTADSEAENHPASRLLDGDVDSFWAAAKEARHATIELALPKPESVSVICLEEAVWLGQRIAGYHVDAWDAERGWVTISRGTTIGRKKLDRVETREVSRLRVCIGDALAAPALASVKLY